LTEGSETKPLAFQPASNMRLGKILSLVAFAHILVIILLLTHFGWPGGAQETDASKSGQSGLVIPVTLESAVEPEPLDQPDQNESHETHETTVEYEKPVDIQLEQPTKPEDQAKLPASSLPTPQPALPVPITQPGASVPTPARVSSPATKQVPASVPSQVKNGEAGASNQQRHAGAQVVPLITAAQIDPNYLHRPDPVYPALSKRMREQGKVLLRVSLDAQGVVKDVTIQQSSDFARLDQAALEAVRQWRFIPAKRGAESIAATVDVPIEFRNP